MVCFFFILMIRSSLIFSCCYSILNYFGTLSFIFGWIDLITSCTNNLYTTICKWARQFPPHHFFFIPYFFIHCLRVCPSAGLFVGWSIGWSARPLVCLSIRLTQVEFLKNGISCLNLNKRESRKHETLERQFSDKYAGRSPERICCLRSVRHLTNIHTNKQIH